MFIDEAEIHVRGGRGGDGSCAFRREPYVPRGGPAGGNGGDGGSVYLEADPQLSTLYDVTHKPVYAAEDGRPGRSKLQDGRSGKNLVVRIPPGTIVSDAESEALLRDLTAPGDRVLVARGGQGGRGNKAFATATNRAPREYEEGEEGEERRVRLRLKLIADIGLVGLPNAGKSTLLSRLSDARPRIASYPFTTLVPQLGILNAGDYRRIVLADLPGLIQGAHQGTGLGDDFLKHIERTRVICHVLDAAPLEPRGLDESYRIVRRELESYSPALAEKPEILVANKMDLPDAQANAESLADALQRPVIRVSAVTGLGLDDLVRSMLGALEACTSA